MAHHFGRAAKASAAKWRSKDRSKDLKMRLGQQVKLGSFLIAVIAIAATAQAPKFYQAPSTKRMAERLLEVYRAQDFRTDPSKDAERVAYYREGLKQKLDPRTELKARLMLGDALLRAGDSAAAVSELQALRQGASEQGMVLAPYFVKELRQLLAVASLRLGEQENCLLNHTSESCLFPIRGGGIHQLKRGSQGALAELAELLKADGQDATSRWLFNVAAMTLGEYPAKVPPQWLIAPERFASDYDVKRFNDIAPQLGLNVTGHAGGSVIEDFDNDGFLDVMISSQGPLDQLRYFRNQGDGTFSERTKEAGLTGELGGLNIVHADYDNDGFADVLVLRGGWWGEHGNYPASLLRNNGNGTFDDVTEAAGLWSEHPTQTAAWGDYDNDGWLDLFIGHESSAQATPPSQVFHNNGHNNGNGKFSEVGASLGLSDLGFVKGATWGDYNNDDRLDLYVSIKGAANKLFRNDEKDAAGKWRFTDVTAAAGVGEPLHSFATWWWDYDNDGWQDLLAAGFYTETLNDLGAFEMRLPHKGATPRLYHNNGNGTFSDVTKQTRLDRVILAMGANFGDLDNDGWLDGYFGTGTPEFAALLPNRMFRNAGGKTFQDVTTAGGFGHLQKGHAVSFADLDHDGDEDIFEVIGGAYPGDTYQSVLFENPGHGNHWLSLELRGVKTNRSAIGARVSVKVKTKEGTRTIHRVVNAGGSFGDSPFRLHVGLGDAAAMQDVTIHWPTSGQTQTLRGLRMDEFYRVSEGASAAEAVTRKRLTWQSAATHRH